MSLQFPQGSVLVFLQGFSDIQTLLDLINTSPVFGHRNQRKYVITISKTLTTKTIHSTEFVQKLFCLKLFSILLNTLFALWHNYLTYKHAHLECSSLACSPRVQYFDGPRPDHIKPKTLKLLFAACPLNTSKNQRLVNSEINV